MTKTEPRDLLGEQLTEAFGGTQEQLDEICRHIPRRSWSLAELRERASFGDRPEAGAA